MQCRHPEFISGSVDFIRSLFPRVFTGIELRDTDLGKAGKHDAYCLFRIDVFYD